MKEILLQTISVEDKWNIYHIRRVKIMEHGHILSLPPFITCRYCGRISGPKFMNWKYKSIRTYWRFYRTFDTHGLMTSLSTLDIHYFGKYVNIDFKIRLIKNVYFQHLTFIESNEFSIKWILSRTQLVWSCFIGHSLNVNSRYISKMPCPAYQDQPKVTAFLLLLLESLIEVKRAFEKTLILEKFSLICKIICT